MASRLRPIGHEERLSVVEHLDELRTRLIVTVAAFVAVFAVCIWQNDTLLDVLNRPLERTTQSAGTDGSGGRLEQSARLQTDLRDLLRALDRVAALQARSGPLDERRAFEALADEAGDLAARLPEASPKRQPVTLGVGEPFVTTLTVAAWFALLICLPLILYQAYAYVLPAFTPSERRVAIPLMAMVPFLFIAGVVFGYYVVVPPAVKFLQTFNDGAFDILVQARDYYRFVALALISLGVLFQIPVGILLVTRLGVVTVAQLRRNRRYAVLVIAVLAMLLPGTDPVTMLVAMGPLLVLYELSILLVSVLDRRREPAEPDPHDPDPA